MAYKNYLNNSIGNYTNPQFDIPNITDRINTLQNYQPNAYNMYSNQMMPNQQAVQQQNTNQQNIPFVNGYEGAKIYPVALGKKLLLMDTEDSKFYIKEIDSQGYPIIQSFKFEPLIGGTAPTNEKQQELSDSSTNEAYIEKSQFDALKQDYENFKNSIAMFITQYQQQLQAVQMNNNQNIIPDTNNIKENKNDNTSLTKKGDNK